MSVREVPSSVPQRKASNPGVIRTLRTTLLASALQYAERGMYVHPLLVGSKEPRWSDWEKRATRDPELIRLTWGRAPFNIGVACGRSGLIVVDLDVPHEGDVPPAEYSGVVDGDTMFNVLIGRTPGARPVPTMTVRTPSGGRHLIYRGPVDSAVRNTARTVGWCIDTRAAGGYVVGIGSQIDGRPYVLESSITEPVAAPDWLLTLITTAPQPPKAGPRISRAEIDARLRALSSGATREERWAAGILRSECLDLAGMPADSGRNNRLNLAAYRAGQLVAAGLLDQAVAEEELTVAARAAGLGTEYAHEIEKTLNSGMRAGRQRPRFMPTTGRRIGGAA
ncbi:bifunctional DNA primase/polymerase [Streptomyces sp. NBC_01221]|uniref:bifunctional DNA primase/polymerase n=1 Tax=Streptomyces sp. NBC_01221 TaxID=2903782 RepID=UPI00225916C1|nr:bifunctional DNA primase/polymerase [Streptomyces sp. NBC_01221]MCX4792650.1 bifunctional DNA primase/polymerase [Streptomyces sp. NBC_01221]